MTHKSSSQKCLNLCQCVVSVIECKFECFGPDTKHFAYCNWGLFSTIHIVGKLGKILVIGVQHRNQLECVPASNSHHPKLVNLSGDSLRHLNGSEFMRCGTFSNHPQFSVKFPFQDNKRRSNQQCNPLRLKRPVRFPFLYFSRVKKPRDAYGSDTVGPRCASRARIPCGPGAVALERLACYHPCVSP